MIVVRCVSHYWTKSIYWYSSWRGKATKNQDMIRRSRCSKALSIISQHLLVPSFRMTTTVTATELRTPNDVLDYWFGAARHGTLADIQGRMGYWFSSNFPAFADVQIANANLIDDILNNRCDPVEWDSENNPEALMAKVIVLDQFTRSVHRGTAEAFRGDLFAASLVKAAVEKGWYPSRFAPIERLFLCLNLHHTEELELHEFAQAQMVGAMGAGSGDDVVGFMGGVNQNFMVTHYEVVKQFGRYPHRNVLLVRDSFSIA